MALIETTTKAADRPQDSPLFVTALARGLSVLKCFTPRSPELGTAELARMTGLPQPTIWRLCYTLRELGFLTNASGRKLRLGIPVLGLGYAVLADLDIASLALPHMQQLAEEFQESVSLAAMDRTEIIFIQRCEAPSLIYSGFPVGGRSRISRAPAGWAMLAGLTPQERLEIMAETQRIDPTGWSNMEANIAAAIEQYAEVGFVTNFGKVQSEFHAVSVPIRAADTQQMFALTCVGLRSRMPSEKLLPFGARLRQTAETLALGLRGS